MSYLIFDFSTTKLCKSSISESIILQIGKNWGRSTNLPFPKLPKTSKSQNFVHTLSWVSHSLFYLFHSWVYGMKLTEWARRDHDSSQAVLTQINIFTVFYITQGLEVSQSGKTFEKRTLLHTAALNDFLYYRNIPFHTLNMIP